MTSAKEIELLVSNHIKREEREIKIEKKSLVVIVKVDDYEPKNVYNGLRRVFELLKPSFFEENINESLVLLKPSILAPKIIFM